MPKGNPWAGFSNQGPKRPSSAKNAWAGFGKSVVNSFNGNGAKPAKTDPAAVVSRGGQTTGRDLPAALWYASNPWASTPTGTLAVQGRAIKNQISQLIHEGADPNSPKIQSLQAAYESIGQEIGGRTPKEAREGRRPPRKGKGSGILGAITRSPAKRRVEDLPPPKTGSKHGNRDGTVSKRRPWNRQGAKPEDVASFEAALNRPDTADIDTSRPRVGFIQTPRRRGLGRLFGPSEAKPFD